MPQVTLDDSNIGSLVDQSATASLPQHVRMNLQMFQDSSRGEATNHHPHGTT